MTKETFQKAKELDAQITAIKFDLARIQEMPTPHSALAADVRDVAIKALESLLSYAEAEFEDLRCN